MNFEDIAGEILDLGAELRAAVTANEVERVAEVLARREASLHTLARSYAALARNEMAGADDLVENLRRDDADLQEFFRTALVEVGDALQQRRARSRFDDDYTDPQCLDRKA